MFDLVPPKRKYKGSKFSEISQDNRYLYSFLSIALKSVVRNTSNFS